MPSELIIRKPIFYNGKVVIKEYDLFPDRFISDIDEEIRIRAISSVIQNIIHSGCVFPNAKQNTKPLDIDLTRKERTYGKYNLHKAKETDNISNRKPLPYFEYNKQMKYSIVTDHKILSLWQRGDKFRSYSTDGIGRLFHNGQFTQTRKLTRGQFLRLAIDNGYEKIPDIVKPFKQYETEKTIYNQRNQPQEQICIW